MNKIYTKTGDKGITSLLGGQRISKGDEQIEVLGNLDEVNALLGALRRSVTTKHPTIEFLDLAQTTILSCGACLAGGSVGTINGLPNKALIKRYESSIDIMTQSLPPLRQFILPGGTEASVWAHIARVAVRRTERAVVRLSRGGALNDSQIIPFLNRLSDWLFMCARLYNFEAGQKESIWQS